MYGGANQGDFFLLRARVGLCFAAYCARILFHEKCHGYLCVWGGVFKTAVVSCFMFAVCCLLFSRRLVDLPKREVLPAVKVQVQEVSVFLGRRGTKARGDVTSIFSGLKCLS